MRRPPSAGSDSTAVRGRGGGFDKEVAPVVVAEGEFGQSDHDVPLVLVSLAIQTRQRGVGVLGSGGEGLADHLDVPGPVMLALRWVEVLDPTRHPGRRGRVGHENDVERLHSAHVPTALA